MKLHPRWGKLFRAVEHWWFDIPDPQYKPTDRFLIGWVWKLLAEYDESYAKRIGTINPYAKAAAAIVEEQLYTKVKRAPTVESEVRILALTVTKLAEHVDALERSIISHDERIRETKR